MKFMIQVKNSLANHTTEVKPHHTKVVHTIVELLKAHPDMRTCSYTFTDRMFNGEQTTVTIIKDDSLEQSMGRVIETVKLERQLQELQPAPKAQPEPAKGPSVDPVEFARRQKTNVGKVRAWMNTYKGHSFTIAAVAEKVGLDKRPTQDILWRLWKKGELKSDQEGIYYAPGKEKVKA